MVTKTKKQISFQKAHTPSILVGFFLKNLSYTTQAFSNSNQAPSLAYLAHTLHDFKVLLTLSQMDEGNN
jgi:hypothetical protein